MLILPFCINIYIRICFVLVSTKVGVTSNRCMLGCSLNSLHQWWTWRATNSRMKYSLVKRRGSSIITPPGVDTACSLLPTTRNWPRCVSRTFIAFSIDHVNHSNSTSFVCLERNYHYHLHGTLQPISIGYCSKSNLKICFYQILEWRIFLGVNDCLKASK